MPDGTPARVLRTRHPSNDFQQKFLREGSRFLQIAGLINWWAGLVDVGDNQKLDNGDIVPGSPRRGARVAKGGRL